MSVFEIASLTGAAVSFITGNIVLGCLCLTAFNVSTAIRM